MRTICNRLKRKCIKRREALYVTSFASYKFIRMTVYLAPRQKLFSLDQIIFEKRIARKIQKIDRNKQRLTAYCFRSNAPPVRWHELTLEQKKIALFIWDNQLTYYINILKRMQMSVQPPRQFRSTTNYQHIKLLAQKRMRLLYQVLESLHSR